MTKRTASRPRVRSASARALLADVVASSQDAIFSRSLRGVITSWNPAAERMFGYRADEIIGRSSAVLIPTDRQEELDGVLRSIRRGVRVDEFDTVRRHKDGRNLHVSLSVSPLLNAAGKVVGASTIARDISTERELDAKVLQAGERERRRLGQDLHDGLGQRLAGLELVARSLVRSLHKRSVPETRMARTLLRQIQASTREVRALARGLTPVMDDPRGLMVALEELAATTALVSRTRCRLHCEEPVLLPDHRAAVHLFRIAQESVTNAIRHGNPRSIDITLAWESGGLLLEIRNNGRPLLPGSEDARGLGRRIMSHRAKSLGGTLKVESLRPRGVRVQCRIPRPDMSA